MLENKPRLKCKMFFDKKDDYGYHNFPFKNIFLTNVCCVVMCHMNGLWFVSFDACRNDLGFQTRFPKRVLVRLPARYDCNGEQQAAASSSKGLLDLLQTVFVFLSILCSKTGQKLAISLFADDRFI